MTEPTTVPKATYETQGETPNRVITKSEDAIPALMMTEIGEGSFVGWASCYGCGSKIAECVCVGGPTPPEYIARWQDERINGRKPAAAEPEVDDQDAVEHQDAAASAETAAKVDAGLDAAAAAVAAQRDLSAIDVDF